MIARRDFLKQAGLASASLSIPMMGCSAAKPVAEEVIEAPQIVEHVLPELDYGYGALAPHIDARTMEIHHSKHHAAYVNGLNKALESHPELRTLTLCDLLSDGLSKIPKDIREPVQNHGGGHLNHSLFWKMLTQTKSEPTGNVVKAIDKKWGGLARFKAEFRAVSLSQFGSGWGWLVKTPQGDLEVFGTENQDTPWSDGFLPVLGVDVWEHAYYLEYQNRRGDYVDAFFEVVDWKFVDVLYNATSAEDWEARAFPVV